MFGFGFGVSGQIAPRIPDARNGSRKTPTNFDGASSEPTRCTRPVIVPYGRAGVPAGGAIAAAKFMAPLARSFPITYSGGSTGLSPWTTMVIFASKVPRPVMRLTSSSPRALRVQNVADGLYARTRLVG